MDARKATNAPAPAITRISLDWQGQSLEVASRHRAGIGPALLLLHGLGCSMRSYAGIWQHEALGRRAVCAFDLPGFGDSAFNAAFPCSMEAYAAVGVSFLDRMGVGNVILVGHSMGGAVALLMASLLGPRLKGFVSVEGNCVAADCGVSRVAGTMTQKEFEERFYPSFTARTDPLHRAFLALELADPSAFYRSARSLWEWSCSEKLLALFMEMCVPKLYVHGRRDKRLPVLERLGSVEKRSIPDSGHFPMNENPAFFYRALAQWLDDHFPDA